MAQPTSPHTNRLAHETSPYLLQHAHNPVDWWPWCAEALQQAREQNRPIFLSIGYSACHWCHVMERESFEHEGIARLMNEHFVNIKVDREERPDLDEIYMKAVQALSGSGGWPMSVFLTPELEPFFGGTYFPPSPRYGRPSFPQIVQWIGDTWRSDPKKLREQGARLAEMIAKEGSTGSEAALAPDALDRSLAMLAQSYDPAWGGFGNAPKFPHAMDVRILFRHFSRTQERQPLDMALHTLDHMARGGIYDQLAGGFHRYSTDEKWLIPHFEKMLYDNALLVPAYVEAFQLTGSAEHARIARECCDWVLAEMVTPQGAFASTLDADSEGEEGRYYVWTPAELDRVLGPKLSGWAQEYWGVDATGNFEHGASALWREEPAAAIAARVGTTLEELERAMRAARTQLLRARAARVRPNLDDKVLAAWNGLMISALAITHQCLPDARYLAAAQRAARYLLDGMRQPDGRLFATARDGRARLNAYFDDYAFVIQALLDLYESDFDERWIDEALALEGIVHARFEDAEHGGYFTTSDDHERLIARLKNPHDGALPSGTGVHALNLLRLAELTGQRELAQRCERAVLSQGELINRYPAAFSQMLQTVHALQTGMREIVIAGRSEDARTAELLRELRSRFLPAKVVALARPGSKSAVLGLLRERVPAGDGSPLAYVCANHACQRPVASTRELAEQLGAAG